MNNKKKWFAGKSEYSKGMLTFIILNSMGMMWCSYILAWHDKNEIAEALSKTITTGVIAVVVPYLVTKTIENVNKYGSKLNGTTRDIDYRSDEPGRDC